MQLQRALALGFFDGVHPAHRRVLALARAQADALGISAAAVTFDHQPAACIHGMQEELICTLDDRIRLLKQEGQMDEVLVLPFTQEMMNTPPEDFVRRTLFSELGARFLCAGFDYRFGKNGAGDAHLLRSLCAAQGVGCSIAGEYRLGGEKISSSAIRSQIILGNVEGAQKMLGRPFSFSGTVCHGKALGRTLGFPTMNIPLPENLVCPAPGVYICRTCLRGAWHAAVCNISAARLCEAFMLAHNEDAYGVQVNVELIEFVRPMRKFSGLEELKSQVDSDKKYAYDWFMIQYKSVF
mgnify:FL=1